jgi:hypothetical protein
MAYKLLGMLTWKGAKWFLHRKYGTARMPKPVLAGGLLLAILAIVLATRQRGDN